MPNDKLQAIHDAEKEIEARMANRKRDDLPFRNAVAAEQVADELTRIRGELSTLRNMLSNYFARPRA